MAGIRQRALGVFLCFLACSFSECGGLNRNEIKEMPSASLCGLR